MRVSGKEVFKTDYCNLEQVIALANRMGPGMVVVKHDSRDNYNITHAECRGRWDIPGVVVHHRT